LEQFAIENEPMLRNRFLLARHLPNAVKTEPGLFGPVLNFRYMNEIHEGIASDRRSHNPAV
jgi:hypothetical protein